MQNPSKITKKNNSQGPNYFRNNLVSEGTSFLRGFLVLWLTQAVTTSDAKRLRFRNLEKGALGKG